MLEFFIRTALAAHGKLVPNCGGVGQRPCTENDLIDLVVHVINFGINTIAFPLVVIFFLWGGFLFLTSGGSTSQIERGKKAITGAVVGLVIVLVSVVIINTFLVVFTNCRADKIGDVIAIGKIKCEGRTN